MCGIIGIVSKDFFAINDLINSLKKLEYRGYDSAGVAITNAGNIKYYKSIGRIKFLEEKIKENPNTKIGFAHTRWSTHGGVTEENAHPQFDCNKKIAVIHNGIVENYLELKKELVQRGHVFRSETDTEVIAHLIEDFDENLLEAVRNTFKRIHGRNTFLVLDPANEKMVAAKKGSPLVAGISDNAYYIASDVPAFLKHTRNVVFLDDNEFVSMDKESIKFFDYEKELKKDVQKIDWTIEEAKKGEYPHFLIKEILEQPYAIEMASTQDDDKIKEIAGKINNSYGSFLVACGTASHAALAGTYFFSKIARKHINFSVASEFPLHKYFLTDRSLVIAISQSGETADTLEAIEAAKENDAMVVSIVNVMGSSLMRKSDYAFLTRAGPEISVASTKAFTSQLSVLLLLAYACANKLEEGKKILKYTSIQAKEMLTKEYMEKINSLAGMLKDKEHIYIIGKGFNYPAALEAALKIKEVSYIHAEGFASGELKHGVIALVDKGTPCIAIVANDEVKQDVISGAIEMKSRGGFIIGISPDFNEAFDLWIKVPDAGNASPILNVMPMQLLAYYLAVLRGTDPDYLKNLAKSVTVK